MASEAAQLETVAAKFLGEREALATEMAELIREGIEEFSGFDPELTEAVRVSCLANMEAGFGALLADRELPREIPADARDLALLMARLDLPLAALLRAYRIGHALVWRKFFDEVERTATDEEDRRETLAIVSDYLFDYVDRLATMLTDEYTAERDRSMRSREQRRTQLVRDVLDGADPDPAPAVGELAYDLRLNHLACVISGEDAETVVRELARTLDAPHVLVVSIAAETIWARLGRVRPFELPERLE